MCPIVVIAAGRRMTIENFLPGILVLLAFCGYQFGLPDISKAGVEKGPIAAIAIPPEIETASPVARFSPDTLFEVINGEADLYLKAGLVAMETQRFVLTADARQLLEIFVYQMTDHRSAFSVFSVRRGPEAVPDALTQFAYRYQDGFFFVHGSFYIEIRATAGTNQLVEAMQDLAVAFKNAHTVLDEPIVELALLPTEDLVPASQTLYPSGAFGFESFDDLFTARYKTNAGDATAFFRICSSPEKASELAAGYQTFLHEYDGEALGVDDALPESWIMRVMDSYTLVFTRGNVVAGVQDAATPELAGMLAHRLYERLSAGRNGS